MKLSKVIKVILGVQLLIMSFAGMCGETVHLGGSVPESGSEFIASPKIDAHDFELANKRGETGIFVWCIAFKANSGSDVRIRLKPSEVLPEISPDEFECKNQGRLIAKMPTDNFADTTIITTVTNNNPEQLFTGQIRVWFSAGDYAKEETSYNIGGFGYTNVSGKVDCGVTIPKTFELGQLRKGTSTPKNFPISWDNNSGGLLVFSGDDINTTNTSINVGGASSGVTMSLNPDMSSNNVFGFSPEVENINGNVVVSSTAPEVQLDTSLTATLECD